MEIHGDKYDYTKSKYTGYRKKLLIGCKTHGDFTQNPEAHLSGRGCKICSGHWNKKAFIKKGIDRFNGKYDYSNIIFRSIDKRVENIMCVEHGLFGQIGNAHLNGVEGCKKCSVGGGFNRNRPAILYYLSVNNGQAYKIGITNKSIEKRFRTKDLAKIIVLNIVHYQNGADALLAEQGILKEYKFAKWTGDDLLTSGNTELFDRDVLFLDERIV